MSDETGSGRRMSNLQLRIVSSVVLIVAVLAVTFIGGVAFRLLSALIAAVMFYEWCTISRNATAARNQLVAAALTFSVLLMLLLVNWIGDASGPVMRAVVSALSVFQHFEDFSRGVIDTQHVIYYLSFIGFGLFLAARSVDADRWRG